MIEIVQLSKNYRMGEFTVSALRKVSLSIEEGDFVAVMGPSGSGKSTLLHLIGLLDEADSGSYRLNGLETTRLTEKKLADLRGKEIGFVFQQFNLLPRTTAEENVALPMIYREQAADDKRSGQLLQEVGLGDRMHHKPNELSGGQQQRVAIARALVNHPHLILADEPTGNLDSQSELEILEILDKLNRVGMTVVMVTHENEVASWAKRIIRMRDGNIESDERVRPIHSGAPPADTLLKNNFHSEPRMLAGIKYREVAQHFRQAYRALWGNKIRSGLSLLGILIGVTALIAMMALGQGAKESIESRLSALGTNLLLLRPGSLHRGAVALEAGTVTRLTMADARAVESELDSVRRAAATVDGRVQAVYGGKNWSTRVMGTTSDYAQLKSSEPSYGRNFTESEDRRRERVALLGTTVARELFGEKDPVGETIRLNQVIFQVIGVLPEVGSTGWRDEDDVVMVPIQTAMRRLLGVDYVDNIHVEVNSILEMAQAEREVLELMLRRHRKAPDDTTSFQIRNMADIQEALTATSNVLSRLLLAIAAISLLVGGIGIMNIMLVSVAERTREIGLRKAVGAKASDILSQFLIEASVVSLVGGFLGIALGWAITLLMSQWGGWQATVSTPSVLLAVLFSGGVGILFGMWPAHRASKLNPIDALRYE